MLDRLSGQNDRNGDLAAPHAQARHLPPLRPLNDDSPVKTRANWRWMLATMLTGVAAFALMGGALYTTFGGGPDGLRYMPAEPSLPGGASPSGYGLASAEATANSTAKTNRIGSAETGFALRQIFHESTIAKVGDKEFVRVKPYARLTASLSAEPPAGEDEVPEFNPLKLFAEASEETVRPPSRAAAENSGEVKVKLASFSPHVSAYADTQVDLTDAEMAVRELIEVNDPTAVPRLALASTHGDGGGDSLLIDAAGTVPAHDPALRPAAAGHLTAIEKRAYDVAGPDIADKSVTVATGDTLSSLLLSHGMTPQQVRRIADAMAPAFSASQLRQNQEIRIGYLHDDDKGRMSPARVSVFEGEAHIVTVGRSGDGDTAMEFVRLGEDEALLADDATARAKPASQRAKLFESLYETGRKSGLADSIIDRMVRIHAYDVDFRRTVQPGDSLEVFYVADDNEGNVTGEPEVLYSALTIRGETKHFYRFRTPDDGVIDYYDEDGKSAKKFLIRKPINGGVLRSGFGMRRHPILGYRKMHTGVDWAARSGTPIVASGNGIVEKADWTSGYGRYTVIKHANGYKSAYAHQSGFADGVKAGAKVRQGQVIGYVGSTGYSTGPHLHYEIIVNGRFVDPMRIRVPRGRTLQGGMLASFQREKNRIDRLMNLPPAATRVATREQGHRSTEVASR